VRVGVFALAQRFDLDSGGEAIRIDLQQEHIVSSPVDNVCNLLNLVPKRAMNEALVCERNTQSGRFVVLFRRPLPVFGEGEVIEMFNDCER
jgi:hypothetical protein